MAATAAHFESAERAAASKAQAATIPTSCTAFPAAMESRPKILRPGIELDTAMVMPTVGPFYCAARGFVAFGLPLALSLTQRAYLESLKRPFLPIYQLVLGLPPPPRSFGIMGLARDPIVKFRFQDVYPQNLDSIGVRSDFRGAQLGRVFRIKESRPVEPCKNQISKSLGEIPSTPHGAIV